MDITDTLVDTVIVEELGHRLTRVRLNLNITQAELAEEAGLGLRTIQRLEAGEAATHLTGFIRVLRVLGLVERLELLVPKAAADPMQKLKMQGKVRQRATGNREVAVAEDPKPWKWGENT